MSPFTKVICVLLLLLNASLSKEGVSEPSCDSKLRGVIGVAEDLQKFFTTESGPQKMIILLRELTSIIYTCETDPEVDQSYDTCLGSLEVLHSQVQFYVDNLVEDVPEMHAPDPEDLRHTVSTCTTLINEDMCAVLWKKLPEVVRNFKYLKSDSASELESILGNMSAIKEEIRDIYNACVTFSSHPNFVERDCQTALKESSVFLSHCVEELKTENNLCDFRKNPMTDVNHYCIENQKTPKEPKREPLDEGETENESASVLAVQKTQNEEQVQMDLEKRMGEGFLAKTDRVLITKQ